MGYLDEDGYLFIVDRQSDMVISGGVNIYPAEIEAILITMPGVADCAVFGVPDDEFGEALMAAVQTVDAVQLTPEDVRAFVRERIADYKVPRLVVFHQQLPREDTGKIFKRKLREQYKVASNETRMIEPHLPGNHKPGFRPVGTTGPQVSKPPI